MKAVKLNVTVTHKNISDAERREKVTEAVQRLVNAELAKPAGKSAKTT